MIPQPIKVCERVERLCIPYTWILRWRRLFWAGAEQFVHYRNSRWPSFAQIFPFPKAVDNALMHLNSFKEQWCYKKFLERSYLAHPQDAAKCRKGHPFGSLTNINLHHSSFPIVNERWSAHACKHVSSFHLFEQPKSPSRPWFSPLSLNEPIQITFDDYMIIMSMDMHWILE